ncbi:imidazolonepropionase [Aestuariirhabdus litorea]|uniref:Imidazolonepropionase n=1 Tax=Aestuariirhabdus litorea TaxID=2528527 RepID=A0A3P3VMG9_9GAMM|nr:imidazolonepropionase [Aestuariirhabdus litorea]RRJ83624.1 imidazolonepropionase [Aestuariirhabdus litorea]RWW96845.1 imidazolonepropionase [Endozoicomonadaceae bacterium GTF-13]
MTPHWDTLWTNVRLATMDPEIKLPFGTIERGALAIKGGCIAWVGPADDLPSVPATEVRDGGGGWLTPGLIDCHTHLVFAGNRCHEFELRQQGASYQQIAEQGGGIRATVEATRASSEEQLFQLAQPRLQAFLDEGVTSIEIKSGYGLEVDTELRMLQVARRLGREFPVTVHTSFLAAHALPPEFQGRADDYIGRVCGEMMDAVSAQELADSVDMFCEQIGFSLAQCERVIQSASRHGLPVRIHAEQLSNLRASHLAASHSALSVDHLEHLDESGVMALARAGTVATLLPGAFYFLRETRLPPIEQLRRHGVAMAVASDFNPGSSPQASLRLSMQMAANLFGLSAEEVLAGVTRHAARALGMASERGQLREGLLADLLLWQIDHPAELVWQFGVNRPHCIMKEGQDVSER